MAISGRRRAHVVTLIDFPAAVGGGAEGLALALLLELDADRFERTLCLLRWRLTGIDPAEIEEGQRTLEQAGVRLLALERRSRWDLRAWRPLIALLRSGDVDILHSHKFGPNVWASLLRLLTRVPVLVTHEHTWSYEGQPLRKALDRHLIARASDVFVAVSSEDRRRMIAVEHIPPRCIEVVANGIPAQRPPSGVDVRAELGIPAGVPVVGTVAILRPQKALEVLIRAAHRLRELHPEIRILIVGEGREGPRLERLTEQLGLQDCVIFLGFRTDIADVLSAFDVAVSCSNFEGSPLAVLEYMAAGLPIVATRVGGVPDIITNGVHGVLIEPGDPDGLAEAVHRLLADGGLAGRLGEAARRHQTSHLTVRQTARHMEGIYERQLTRKGRGLRVEPLADDLEAASGAWTELAASAQSPFATYEWAHAWWRTFGHGRHLQLLACRRRDGSLAALLPLCSMRRGPLQVTRFIGHGPGDELGPVCAPEDRSAALAALRRSMTDGKLRTDLMLAERMPATEGMDQAFGGTVLQRESSPALATEGLTWEDFLASRSRNFRSQVRGRERALARDHSLSFRMAEDPARLDDDLSTLFSLHDQRWSAGGSGALAAQRAAFHRDFAAAALARGWLRLWFLEVDDVPVAAWYGLRFADREWYYQSGRDPSWDDRSVRFVLLAHTIRAAMGDGVLEYRLLRGGEAYKDRFSTHDHPVQTSVAAGTLIGAAAVMAVRGIGVDRPWVRARLKRGLG